MVEGTSMLDVPIELRALVSFLSVDDRPTSILHIPQDGKDIARELRAVYSNPAFNRLARPAAEPDDLRNAVARSHSTEQGLSSLHDKVLDGGTWQARVSGDYCIVVATARAAGFGAGHAQSAFLSSRSGSDSTLRSTTSRSSNGQGQPGLDWTKVDRKGLSPYVKFIRNFDWASTPLGPMSSWCDTLRHHMLSMMANPDPRLIVWGDDMTFVYNEACVPIFGDKHPECLGQNVKSVFAEAWPVVGPVIEAGYHGEVRTIKNFPLPMFRHGYLEETYWSFTTLPMIDQDGYGSGVFDELTDSTALVTGERRRGTISELGVQLNKVSTLSDLWPVVLDTLKANELDVPFAILYSVVDNVAETEDSTASSSTGSSSTLHPKKAVLVGSVGIARNEIDTPDMFALLEETERSFGIAQACIDAWRTGDMVSLSAENQTLPVSMTTPIPGRGFGDPIKSAVIKPIKAMTGDGTLAILVWGLNPRSAFGDEYQIFRQVTVDIIEKSAALIALPEEQRRAQQIAEDVNNALAQQLRLTTLKAEKSEAKFSRLASSAPTGMFMLEPGGRPLYVNDQYLDMLSTTREEHMTIVNHAGLAEQIHEDDIEHFTEAWHTITEHKMPITVEYRLKRSWQHTDKSGQEMSGETWLLATAFPEIESDGTISTVQGWLTDISHRKFSEQLLAQRLEDALENKRQTENFIDMTSHEMRNPLSAILQSADSIETLLNSTGMPIIDEDLTLPTHIAEDIVDAAQTIILCAQHQKRIVDDILTLSKLDASLLVIAPDKVQVPTLVTKALKMYEAELSRAGIDAQLCVEPTYEDLDVDWVVLDPSRLLQVIINLLTNSIKFTQYSDTRKIKICIGASYQKPTGKHHGISFIPPRHIRPSRTPRPDFAAGEDLYLQFAVYDTGRGLNDDEMKLLFQRFQQASPKTYKQYGGSGLGLFISRELCELQGGQIGVSSGDGRTVFTFFVRARRWIEGEDNARQRPAPIRYTSAAASPVVFSRRGSTALSNGADQLGEPHEEDGNVVENFHPKQHPLARQQSYQAGLTPAVQGSRQPATDEVVSEPATEELHLLIVEDNLINQKVMSQQLRRAGCTVHVANHGLECLSFIERSTFCSSTTPLSAILLDLEMPTMDGLTCIRNIRERQTNGQINGHVPVVAVTANARSEQISVAIEAGMDQVVTKPFRIPELMPQIRRLVAEVAASRAVGG
ncbi:Putative PAS domain, signal transduction response regulator, receiver domain, CheY-like superfamily [Septoria linicola]|uniref:PAS domain, signal transduction response regulator, receiver domain, CheY-like superfamily n=1 Tax=Septoria linicola TaxID=215465 RepID=A0A9Q9B6V7_9PEZI|nr:Putative PAS domain, signal transduction response regulator, receiver domain, CheY-like superfamily [Septoria linicola]